MRFAPVICLLVAGCAATPTLQTAYPKATSVEACRAAYKADMDNQAASVVTGALLGGVIGAGIGASEHSKQATGRLRMCLTRVGNTAGDRGRYLQRSCLGGDSVLNGGAGYCVGR